MIIDSAGREIKLLIEYLKVQFIMLIEVIIREFFLFRGNVFPDFGSSKSKSGSSIIIA